MNTGFRIHLATWLGIALALVVFAVQIAGAAPAIVITNLPAYGSTDNLSGQVFGISPAAGRVAVFIYVPSYGWVSKPTCGQALTTIQPDGSWSTDITTGGSDALATRVAALLVSPNYSEACVLGLANLPTNVYAKAIASAVVTRSAPGARWIRFSDYDWWVKTSSGTVGPGPNYFSDSTNNVWVDAAGQLHLRITNRSGQWQCAEIVSARTFGFGNYRFECASRVDNLNPNAVLGLFTWSDDPAFTHREIDVECSRWSNPADTSNAQFVVQPYYLTGHLVRFTVPVRATNSTHCFRWETNRVSYQSLAGSYTPNPAPTNISSAWTYAIEVPQTGDENVRLNLWLNNGAAPTDGREVEVVIRSFNFVPLGAPQGARLSDLLRPGAAPAQFMVTTEPDRRYAVEGSSNLLAWKAVTTLLATNVAVRVVDSNAASQSMQVYRAVTLP